MHGSEYEILCDAQSFRNVYTTFFEITGFSAGDLSQIREIFDVAERHLGLSSRDLRLVRRKGQLNAKVEIAIMDKGELVPLRQFRSRGTFPDIRPDLSTPYDRGIEPADYTDADRIEGGNRDVNKDINAKRRSSKYKNKHHAHYYGSFTAAEARAAAAKEE